MGQILVVSDERQGQERLRMALRERGHDVEIATRCGDACAFAGSGRFDLVVSDVELPDGTSSDLLRDLKSKLPKLRVVVASHRGSVEEAVEAMRSGAEDYVRKPVLAEWVEKFLTRGLVAGLPASRSSSYAGPVGFDPFAAIVGSSRRLQNVLDLVRRVAGTDSTVLVTGETGTGKELVGAAIHAVSKRSNQVLSAVNAATFPESLLESELFGHRRGSFTGASANKKGLFEHAHGGTVFLDEVAEMPLSMQAKLLRFLQTGEIRAVGSESTRLVDVRLVAATNKDLEVEVAEGRFREDLYYRLNVIPIEVPPLRDRLEDVPALCEHFLRSYACKHGQQVLSLDPETIEAMQAYAWPGNIRELQNWIERAAALCRDGRITVADLPQRLIERSVVAQPGRLESLQTLERSHILNTLECVGWNRKRAAEILEISTTTLWRRLKQFGIDVPSVAARRF